MAIMWGRRIEEHSSGATGDGVYLAQVTHTFNNRHTYCDVTRVSSYSESSIPSFWRNWRLRLQDRIAFRPEDGALDPQYIGTYTPNCTAYNFRNKCITFTLPPFWGRTIILPRKWMQWFLRNVGIYLLNYTTSQPRRLPQNLLPQIEAIPRRFQASVAIVP
jgi:hypothetical protein